MRRLIILSLFAWLAGCGDSHRTGTDGGSLDGGSLDGSLDGGPRDSAPPGPDSCRPTGRVCYQGWSGGSACCLVDDVFPLDECAGVVDCPSGYFSSAECGRLDPTCEGADAGVPGGLYDDCMVTSECSLVANTCCGVCRAPTVDDMSAIATSRSDDYYRDVACPESVDGPVACLACVPGYNPHLIATCDMTGFRPACAQVDLGAPPYSSCTVDSDCRLATPSCCACGEIPMAQTIAVNRTRSGELEMLLCDFDAACPPCVAVYALDARATCVEGVCGVATD